jgi:hypothetical protein
VQFACSSKIVVDEVASDRVASVIWSKPRMGKKLPKKIVDSIAIYPKIPQLLVHMEGEKWINWNHKQSKLYKKHFNCYTTSNSPVMKLYACVPVSSRNKLRLMNKTVIKIVVLYRKDFHKRKNVNERVMP